MILFTFIACFVAAHGHVVHPEVHHPQPYGFGYTIKDKESMQHREEVSDGTGVVKGNYGFVDHQGIHRQVDYVADHGGFRARVKTNEPGTSGQSPAAIHMIANPSHVHPHDHALPLPAHDRHKYITPLQYEHRAPLYMPVHHEVQVPAHVPVHEQVVPDHHFTLKAPFHGNIAPLHEHRLHEHVPLHYEPVHRGHALPHYEHVPVSQHQYSHLYGPKYVSGSALHGNHLLGAGYGVHGGMMNHAKLTGGFVAGYDSRVH